MIGVAFVIPLGAIMKAMGGTGWYFPPLLYSDMVPAMLEAVPDFFDMKYGFKWWRGQGLSEGRATLAVACMWIFGVSAIYVFSP